MSSRVKLSSNDLRDIATFLDALTEATQETGVKVCVYGSIQLEINGSTISFDWDDACQWYAINEWVGD